MRNKNLVILVIVIIIVVVGLWWYFAMPNPSTTNNENATSTGSSTASGVTVGGATMLPTQNLVENASQANNLSTFVSALQEAGLANILQSESAGPFTIFAPSNDAFAKLATSTLDSWMQPENQSELQKILKYDVVEGTIRTQDMQDGDVLTTLEGDTLKITKDAQGNIMINGKAMIETPDVVSSNGILHVIDTVLVPNDSGVSSISVSSSTSESTSSSASTSN
ncbi:MAG TPA: fasciclin domain-containing protein [Candidatus Paceibacterota bacterium]|nr:fasciclin domain-containing protein [Candidatus Paceibacterota bacterium]